jgi:membrane-bound lytic murein transglycosylase D
VDEDAGDEELLSGAGFCRDDIYTKYLLGVFKDAQVSQSTKRKDNSPKQQRIFESRGLHYAASRLRGTSAAYFGSFPIVMNQRVEFWIRYFKTGGRGAFLKWLVQGEAVRDIIQAGLRNEGVPIELFYLAMVESGFNNRALSHAKAIGTWQFMEGTAKLYGLNVGYWVDERRDPAKSTVAAARYLKELYGRFGDWYLAIAAYNAGPGKISSAVRRSGSRDFWDLVETSYIAPETKDYVPKVLAAISLATNPEEHGIQYYANPEDTLPQSTVFVSRPVMLTEVAAKLGVTLAQVYRWNPEIMQHIVPPASTWQDKPGYQFRLPQNLIERFVESEESLTLLEIQDFKMHQVQRGETLAKIARKYKLSISTILNFNPSLSPKRLKIGRQVAIPIPGIVTKRPALSAGSVGESIAG